MNLLLRKPSTACWAPSPVGSLLSCTSCILSIWLGSGRRLQRVASNWNVWTLYQVNFKSYPAHQYIHIHHINIPYRWYFLLHLFSHLFPSFVFVIGWWKTGGANSQGSNVELGLGALGWASWQRCRCSDLLLRCGRGHRGRDPWICDPSIRQWWR